MKNSATFERKHQDSISFFSLEKTLLQAFGSTGSVVTKHGIKIQSNGTFL